MINGLVPETDKIYEIPHYLADMSYLIVHINCLSLDLIELGSRMQSMQRKQNEVKK